ncbi:copper/zinc binding superoxide dismutase [Armillaria gallica]|uniref:Superoxide dismutase [Cu-Zn] n=1 Tax=Armillaria gallica TaxID=47427 RepID=A0A2H3CF69_ARMGA|nr:copper/zinc binding superoxide dismutase [Armillaria gallica]
MKLPNNFPVFSSPTMMFKSLLLALAAALPVWSWNSYVSEAVVVLSGPSSVNGTVIFQQSSYDGPVHVTGRIQGLDPSALRGFHVHASGNLTNGCTSAGAHYNPYNTTHGAPTDPKTARHVGDLGNIQSDAYGVAVLDITDTIISLNGPLSIVGRSVVVHTGTDDLGRGGTNVSLTTGNSGERAACGVIGLS